MLVAGVTGGRLCAIAIVAGLPFLSACGGPSLPGLVPQPAQELRSRPADAYPNINLAPDRPSRARSPQDVGQLESELEDVGAAHAEEAEREIEGSGRGM